MVEILVGGNAIKSFDVSSLSVPDAECLLLTVNCLSRKAAMGRTKPGTDPTLHLKDETSWIRLPTAPPLCDDGLTIATQGLLYSFTST